MEDDSADDWANLITSASNQNLTAAKKELLVWHHKLSHASLSTVHSLCRHKRMSKDVTVSDFVPYRDGPFLPCSHKIPDNVCANLLCAACCIAKAKRRAPAVQTITAASKEMSLKVDDLQPGDCISCNHYISPSKDEPRLTLGTAALDMDTRVVLYTWIMPLVLYSFNTRLLPRQRRRFAANFWWNVKLAT
jgi:hypothetical protein